MALQLGTQLQYAFKKLYGKAHTSPYIGVLGENYGTSIQINSSIIFYDDVTSSPPTNYWEIGGNVERVKFKLEKIVASYYQAPTASSYGQLHHGDGFSNVYVSGYHAYKLSLPTNYESLSNNPKRGTFPFINGQAAHSSNGKLQIVPDSYGPPYIPVFLTGSTPIPIFGDLDWYVDCYAGILFIQDIDSSLNVEECDIAAYIYVGRFAKNVITEISASLQYVSGSAIGGNGSPNTIAFFQNANNLSSVSNFIYSNGKLGLNVSNPSFDLDVSGSLRNLGTTHFTGSVSISGSLNFWNTTKPLAMIKSPNGTVSFKTPNLDGEFLVYDAAGNDFIFTQTLDEGSY